MVGAPHVGTSLHLFGFSTCPKSIALAVQSEHIKFLCKTTSSESVVNLLRGNSISLGFGNLVVGQAMTLLEPYF